jgi:hypothetical protein
MASAASHADHRLVRNMRSFRQMARGRKSILRWENGKEFLLVPEHQAHKA